MGTRFSRFILLAVLAAPACRDSDNDWVPIEVDAAPKRTSKKARPATEDPAPAATPAAKKASSPKPSENNGDAALLEKSDRDFLRRRAQAVHQALVAALPREDRGLLEQVPLTFDDRPGEVNAFAACKKDGRALIAVSDGLMAVQAQLARARANDEVHGGRKLDAYLQLLAKGRSLLPPAGFISPAEEGAEAKRQRQAQLLDEGLAYVIGHELAHHRLSHTGCVGADRGATTTADVARALSSRVPLFNQPNELASDVYGIQNVLGAGRGWREDGALLMLRAFEARSRMSLEDSLVFGFELTHPHPELRIPVVEKTAEMWRATGGRSLPRLPALPL